MMLLKPLFQWIGFFKEDTDMKTINSIIVVGFCALALLSCSKDGEKELINDDIQLTFEAGSLEADVVDTKMTHSVSGTTHSFAWEEGDQLSVILFNDAGAAGNLAETHVYNASDRRFTLTEGATGKFTGSLSQSEIDALGGTGNVNAFVIYPATTFTVNDDGAKASSTFLYYILTGAEFPTVQDGTGFRYSYYASTDVQYNRSAKKFTSAAKKLYLSNVMVRFNIANSAKEIKNIKITTASAYFVGPVQYWIGNTSSSHTEYANTSPGRRAVQAGGGQNTLNINNGDAPLPSEIYFACRGLQAKAVTLEFTATDDTKLTASTTLPSANYTPGIYNWGTINLAGKTWD